MASKWVTMTVWSRSEPVRRCALGALLAAAACSGLGDLPPELREVEVVSAANPAVPPPRYGATWSWLPSSAVESVPGFDREVFETMLREELGRALAGRGFRFDAAGRGELLVGYRAALAQEIDDSGLDAQYRISIDQGGRRTPLRTYPRGSLVVDIADRARRMTVWRASAQANVSPDLDVSTRRTRMRHVVEKMLARLELGS
jgi:hypothetical protein